MPNQPITSLTSLPLYYLTRYTTNRPFGEGPPNGLLYETTASTRPPPCSICEGLHETAAGKAFSGRTRLQEHLDLLNLAAMCTLGRTQAWSGQSRGVFTAALLELIQ